MELTDPQLRRITRRIGAELELWLRERTVELHYSAEEAAELLRVTPRTVWAYVERGERTEGREGIWPVVKLSHKVVRLPASSINRFLRQHTIALEPGAAVAVRQEVAG